MAKSGAEDLDALEHALAQTQAVASKMDEESRRTTSLVGNSMPDLSSYTSLLGHQHQVASLAELSSYKPTAVASAIAALGDFQPSATTLAKLAITGGETSDRVHTASEALRLSSQASSTIINSTEPVGALLAKMAGFQSGTAKSAIAAARSYQPEWMPKTGLGSLVRPVGSILADARGFAAGAGIVPSFAYGSVSEAIESLESRLAGLVKEFANPTGSQLDPYGRLQAAIDTSEPVSDRIDAVISAIQKPGSFGLDFNTVSSRVADLSQAIAQDQTIERKLAEPLEEVREISGLSDEVVLDYGEMLGWWERIKTHRISSGGIILGCTVGLLKFGIGLSANEPLPVNLSDSIASGASIYAYLTLRRKS